MRLYGFRLLLFTLLLFPFSFGLVHAEDSVEVPMGTAKGRIISDYPVAVAEFKNFTPKETETKIGTEGQSILLNNLALSGYFLTIDPKAYLEDIKTSGITEATVDFTKWLQTGAEGLIKAGFWLKDGTLKVEMVLFSVSTGKEKIRKTYEGPEKALRDFCHRFSNEVVRYYTKRSGIFLTKIVSVRRHKGSKSLWVCDFDGQRCFTLAADGGINLLPSWDLDGKSLFYTSYQKGNPDLWRIPAVEGGKPVIVSNWRGLNVGAEVSPNGKQLVLTLTKDGNSEIYITSIDGKHPKRLTNSWSIDSSPCWSPDGKRVAFVSNRSGTPQIYMIDVSGGPPTRLTFQGNYNQSPSWSPLGDKIAFTGRDERLVFDLFAVDVETREIERLTQDAGNNEDPTWSPDGQLIAFSSNRTGDYKIWIMNTDGSHPRQVTHAEGEFTTPNWGPITKGE